MSLSNATRIKLWSAVVLAFGVWAVAMDVLLTRFVIPKEPASPANKIGHLLDEDGSEIPIFGDSTAFHDYIPEILGDDVFNYGMFGVSFDVVNVLLQIEVKKPRQTPIILGLGADNHNLEIGEPNNYAAFVSRPEIRHMLERFGLMRWRYWMPGLRYFNCYDSYLRDYFLERSTSAKPGVRGYSYASGMHRSVVQAGMDWFIKKRLAEGDSYYPHDEQDRVLFDIIQTTPKRTFVIVYSPLHSSCFANFKDREGFARHLEKLRSFPNVVLLDWSQMEFPDDSFFDTVHLNPKGAAEFSRRLAERLRAVRAGDRPT